MELVTPRPAAELSTAAEGLTTKQREVLEAVRSFPEGGTVPQIGAALGMHINTVRGHLDVLVDRGVVSWRKVPSERRGRPTHLYTVRSPNSSVLAGGYVALVEVLAEASTHGSIGTATALGRAWGPRCRRGLARGGAVVHHDGEGGGADALEAAHYLVLQAAAKRHDDDHGHDADDDAQKRQQ